MDVGERMNDGELKCVDELIKEVEWILGVFVGVRGLGGVVVVWCDMVEEER
ncbi:hypothetical protein [Bacillus sp. WP8]|uniref:hypothetical protein n=1 Tax=Bacillus sp. WP8 TaxID=756828 RepID=UPI0016424A56|nr:hypothetical protein [Bacillus sp. WP8]